MSKISYALILSLLLLVTGLFVARGRAQEVPFNCSIVSDTDTSSVEFSGSTPMQDDSSKSTGVATTTGRIARVVDESNSCTVNDMSTEVQGDCFSYSDFDSTVGLNLVSAAMTDTNKLRLTNLNHRVGAVWYTTPQLVQESFETTFQFQITDTVFTGADGFAFVIQNNSTSTVGSWGSGIGYDGITNSLAIEFDTYKDGGRGDPNDNHISVQTRGTAPNSTDHTYSLGSTTAIPNISEGRVHTATIEYINDILWVFLDDPTTPVLMVPVDLATVLDLDNGQAWVGFTAGTSAAYEVHDILSWSSCPNFPPVPVGGVTISGPVVGAVNTVHTFVATVSSIKTTLPITYHWQATEQPSRLHTLGSRTDTITFAWSVPGTKTITVTATNISDTVDYRHNVIIGLYNYLPIVMKNEL